VAWHDVEGPWEAVAYGPSRGVEGKVLGRGRIPTAVGSRHSLGKEEKKERRKRKVG